MALYSLQQAYTDIAALRGAFAHLLANAQVGNITVTGTVTSTDTWHNLSVPSGATGYLRYKRGIENTVWVQAELAWSGGKTLNTAIGSLPSGYIPATDFKAPFGTFVSGGSPDMNNCRVNVSTGGTIQLLASGTTISEADFCIQVPLD